MCGQKVVDRKTTEEQMNMFGLKETIDRLATANRVRWYGHVLKRDDNSILRVALNLEVSGKRKRGRPKKTWKKQMEEETEKIGFEDGGCPETRQVEGRSASNCRRNGVNPAIFAKGTTPDKTEQLLLYSKNPGFICSINRCFYFSQRIKKNSETYSNYYLA